MTVDVNFSYAESSIIFRFRIQTYSEKGARCSSVVRAFLMVRWVVGSILHGGPIELFLVPASDPRLV